MSDNETEVINTFSIKSGKRGKWIGGRNTYLARKLFKTHNAEWNNFQGKWYVSNDQFESLIEQLKDLDLTIHLIKKTKGFYLKGYTYSSRQKIKELGGVWKKEETGWYFPNVLLDEVISEFPDLSI